MKLYIVTSNDGYHSEWFEGIFTSRDEADKALCNAGWNPVDHPNGEYKGGPNDLWATIHEMPANTLTTLP